MEMNSKTTFFNNFPFPFIQCYFVDKMTTGGSVLDKTVLGGRGDFFMVNGH